MSAIDKSPDRQDAVACESPTVKVLGTDLVITVGGSALARMLGEERFRAAVPDEVADPSRFAARVADVLAQELPDEGTRLEELLYTAAVLAAEAYDLDGQVDPSVAAVSTTLRAGIEALATPGPPSNTSIAPQAEMPEPLSAESIAELAVRQIIADVDRITTGRRRIDIAHALLQIVGQEIAATAETPAAAKHHGQLVAKQLKTFVREKFAERQARGGVP